MADRAVVFIDGNNWFHSLSGANAVMTNHQTCVGDTIWSPEAIT
jgi:hypothetical protein